MVKVGLDDLEILETPKYDRVGFGDQAHQNACGGYWGPDATPAAFIIQGSIVGSVTGAGKLSVLAYDAVNRTHDMIEELVYVDSSDTGWISQYYGNNPNTPQGRNHQFCMMVRNPGYGLQGGFQAEVEQFLFIANTGRKLRDNGQPQDKLAFDLVLVPAVIPSAGEPDPTPDPDPTPEPEPEPEPEEPGAQVGGCAAGGGSSGGLLLLLALAAVARRRRAA
jgi:hypothetical protein